MANLSGVLINLKRLSYTIKDPDIQMAISNIENKILEIDKRLVDVERRLAAGGL